MSWESRIKDLSIDRELIFQTLDWYCDDFHDENDYLVYKIYVFGIDQNGSPVTMCINDFHPFFFIEVPITWNSSCIYSVKEAINNRSIKSFEFLERKRYYGFENNKIRKFLKLSFYSSKGMRSAKYQIEKNSYQISGTKVPINFPIYESNIDPILRFTHLRDILTCGWVKISKGFYKLDETESYFECNWKNVNPYNENEFANKISDIRILYFDIEACSEDGSFPNALKKNDKVTQICCILKDTVSKKTTKFLFNLGTCDSVEDTIVLQYASEKKMLCAYKNFIIDTDPDIIVGYNIFGFDNGFLFERAQVLQIEDLFNYQSKLISKRTVIEKKILNNQQSGFNDWKMTKIYGRTHIDLLQVIKKDFKLESYKLNYVGEHFVGEGKDDVSPKEIFEAWDKSLGTREKRTIVGKYCVQDTNLCLLLFEKFAVLPNHIEMAKVTRVPLEYLITRGQSIKVFSQVSYETRKAGYLIPVLPKQESEGKFQGATVLEAHIGHYTRPVCGLDFASLYPSIMIAHNMCYATVVLDNRYMNLPGIEYSTIKCNDELSVTFVQNEHGVLSGILQSLWKNRKVTKKEMNASTDPFVKTVLNAKQLAIKVSMNSIYGFTGATVGALPCLEISQAVTGCGRLMIEQTQYHAKNMFNCEIVYGDSVTADTPVLIKENGSVNVIEINSLFNRFDNKPFPQFKSNEENLYEKEQSNPPDNLIEVWTASGWSPLVRTIRHRCEKNIYRVLTHTGLVDVTEDHSLLNTNLEQVKPTNVGIGTELFHSYPINNKNTTFKLKDIIDIFQNLERVPIIYRLIFIQGFFVGDGSCGKYNCPSGLKYSWALNNANIHILQTFVEWLDTCYKDISFKILDTLKSSGVYKLVPVGNIKKMVEEYSVFYSNGCKIITNEILNSELENQKWFFYGYYLADGYKCYNEIGKNIKITAKNKLSATHYYLLGRNLGFDVSINDRSDKLNVFTLTFSTKLRKNENEIKKIRNLGQCKDYVFDLETADGTFQAGIGQIIVKNTDSCYVIFPEPVDQDGTLTTLFKVAENAAKKISETFKKPIELEFEKFMYPLILVAKKRYMYVEWTDPKKHNGEIEAKGVELVRRDNCPYVKETLDAVLTPIMFENNVTKGKEQAEIHIDRLLNGEVPIKKLILSKTLKNEYKGFEKKYSQRLPDGRPDTNGPYKWIHTKEIKENKVKTGEFETIEEVPCMAHVALVEKMRTRDVNSAPKPGDRVPFVYVDIGDPRALSWKKTEDPQFVIDNNIPIDTLYYLDHQLKNPLKTIFDILLGELKCEQMFNRPSLVKAKQREKIAIGEAKRVKENNQDIRKFFTFF
jgi:DNA polymerase elongation subunit (family B)